MPHRRLASSHQWARIDSIQTHWGQQPPGPQGLEVPLVRQPRDHSPAPATSAAEPDCSRWPHGVPATASPHHHACQTHSPRATTQLEPIADQRYRPRCEHVPWTISNPLAACWPRDEAPTGEPSSPLPTTNVRRFPASVADFAAKSHTARAHAPTTVAPEELHCASSPLLRMVPTPLPTLPPRPNRHAPLPKAHSNGVKHMSEAMLVVLGKLLDESV